MNRKPFLIILWSSHRFILVVSFSLLLLNILLLSLIYWGVAPKLSRTETELSNLQQQHRRGASVSPYQAYDQGQKDIKLFQTLLPSIRNFSELIGDLYALADHSNLEISQISYTQKELPKSGILSYALNFSLTGTYDELKRFIYGIEESRRLFVIDQMTLSSSKGEGEVTLNLNLTTYFGLEGAK